MRPDKLEESAEIPAGVEVQIEGTVVIVKGPKGEVSRRFEAPKVKYAVKDKEVVFSAERPTKREKKIALTFLSHLKNMIKGVVTPHQYKMKVCSGHFPMTVSISGDQFVVKNFLGEKTPRVLKLKKGADVKVDGEMITIESVDIEKAGQIATGIEQLTRITNRDPRIFQDGIYIIKKPKEMAD